jgi:Zinc finger C-x8-C-x5-C-x3-H type (and similar)
MQHQPGPKRSRSASYAAAGCGDSAGFRGFQDARSTGRDNSQTPCFFHKRGSCSYGDDCEYMHSPSQSPAGASGTGGKFSVCYMYACLAVAYDWCL